MAINASQARAIQMLQQQRAASARGVQVGPVSGIRAGHAVQQDDKRRASKAEARAANPFLDNQERKKEQGKGGGAAGIGGVLGKVLKPLELLDYGASCRRHRDGADGRGAADTGGVPGPVEPAGRRGPHQG